MKIVADHDSASVRILLEDGTDITDDICLEGLELKVEGNHLISVKLTCGLKGFELQGETQDIKNKKSDQTLN